MVASHRNSVWLALGLSAFFALLQFRLIDMLFGSDYGRAVDAAAGVLTGHPHWRAFQARVLAPLLVRLLQPLFPNFLAAHVGFSLITLTAMGWLSWRLGLRLGGTLGSALLAFFVFEASFAFLLSPHWLYAWDYTDIIIFLLFVDFVVGARSWHWFVGLFAVGIFSRDSAEFIAVWMILEALSQRHFARRPGGDGAPLDRALLIAGIACLILGIVLVEGLTRALLIEEIGPKLFNDVAGEGGQIQALRLTSNFHLAFDAVTRFQYRLPFVILMFLGIVLALAIGIMRADRRRYFALGLTFIGLEIATFTFGYLTETRVYVEMIPLIILGTLVMRRPDA